jgi:hypothetical protein
MKHSQTMTHATLAELFADQTGPDDVRQEDSESDRDRSHESEPQEEEDAIQPDGTGEPLHRIQDEEMDRRAAESEEEPSEEEEDDTLVITVGELWEEATNSA